MSVLGTLTATSSYHDVAEAIVLESIRRRHRPDETIAELSALIQESGLRFVKHPTSDWWGYAQQDGSYPDRHNPNGNLREFFNRLDIKRAHPGASPDPFENIFWLQQGPNWPSAAHGMRVGRRAYYDEIRRHVSCTSHGHENATQLYERFSKGGAAIAAPRKVIIGDPIWLPDVLRDAGVPVAVAPGAFNRGHGDMRENRGVVVHHTGSDAASWQSIAHHPTLGLASQLHLSYHGHYMVCGVGIAYHAGPGGGIPWLPNNNANPYTIGIEAANDGGGSPGRPHRADWPVVQYDNYVKGVAAILNYLGHNESRCIAHKEWAGAAQGKWDPGGIHMPTMRKDIASLLNSGDEFMGVNVDGLNKVIDKMLAVEPYRCIYAESDEMDDTVGKIWSAHGMTLEMVVEHEALIGEPASIAKVAKLARGEGRFGKEPWAVERAQRVLDTVRKLNPDTVIPEVL